jgi:hypothetical protein
MPQRITNTRRLDQVDAPFLSLMIDYASIGRQSCDALLSDKVLSPEQQITWQDDYAYFQYRVSTWSMRASETFAGVDDRMHPGFEMMRKIIYIRANHLRTLVARAFLCSGLRNAAPLDIWSIVDIASDTIQELTQLDASRKEYRFHQAQLNHFLVSALDILLFATTHKLSGVESPSANGEELLIPSDTAKKAHKMSMVALNRLRTLANGSVQTKYLWDRVRTMAERFNLNGCMIPETAADNAGAVAPSSSAPVTHHDNVAAHVGLTHPVQLFDPDPSQLETHFGAFMPNDANSWAFHVPPSSPFNFDLNQDFSPLVNPHWVP